MAEFYQPIDWSVLGDLPKTYAEGQARQREQQLRQALAGGLPRGPGGAIDYNAAVNLAARSGNVNAMAPFAHLAQSQAQLAQTAGHQRVMEELQRRQVQLAETEQPATRAAMEAERLRQAGFEGRRVALAEQQAAEKPTYSDFTDENGKQWKLETLPLGQGMNKIDLDTGQRVALWRGQPAGGGGPAAPSTQPVPSQPVPQVTPNLLSPDPLATVGGGGGAVAPVPTPVQRERPPPLPVPPAGANVPAFQKKVSEEAATQYSEKRELQDQGKVVLSQVDNFINELVNNPKDPKVAERFNKAAGPFKGAASEGSPIYNPARMVYELTSSKENQQHLDLIKSRAQAINSFMQRALLKGQGAVTEQERANINAIVGEIGQARSATEAQAKLEQFKELVKDMFKMREGSPLLAPAAPRAITTSRIGGTPPPPAGFTTVRP